MKPRVISALFYETATYDDQPGRSFDTHFDGDVSNRLMRYTNEGRSLTSTNLSRAVGDAIRLSSRVSDTIVIPGGWGEKRLSFIITLLTSDAGGYTQRQVLTGYTDYSGVNILTGSLDDKMEMYINNSIIIRDTIFDTGRGRTRRPRIESNEFILRGRQGGRGGVFREDKGDRLIRPYDIFNAHSVGDMSSVGGGHDEVVDTRADLGGEIKLGIRADNNAAEYFSRILRAGVAAETTEARAWHPESAMGGETETRAEVSAGMVNVSNLDENPAFIEFLERCDFAKEGIITLGEMADATDWPEKISGKEVTQFISPKEMNERGYQSYQRGQGTSLRGGGPEAIAVAIITQSIPAILMSHQIAEAFIHITNDTNDSKMRVVVYNERPVVVGQDVSINLTAAEEMILMQVALPISRNDEILIDAEINFSTVTDIRIDMSFDGKPKELSVIPMYCDGLTSPQKTADHDLAAKISNDLRVTIQDITDNLYREPEIDSRDNIRWDDDARSDIRRDPKPSRGRNSRF